MAMDWQHLEWWGIVGLPSMMVLQFLQYEADMCVVDFLWAFT